MISETVAILGTPVDNSTMDETVARLFAIEDIGREILRRVDQARPDLWKMQEPV